MSRTKKDNQNEVRTSVIRLRVTEAEAELFRIKAKEAGCKTISEYIRLRCIPDESNMDIKNEAEVSLQ